MALDESNQKVHLWKALKLASESFITERGEKLVIEYYEDDKDVEGFDIEVIEQNENGDYPEEGENLSDFYETKRLEEVLSFYLERGEFPKP